jgi:DME family drug/metabolite transporter
VSERRTPVAAVLAAAVLFGTAGTAQELGPEGTTPLSVGAVRIVIGTAVLWLAVAASRPSRDGTTGARQLTGQWRLVLAGGVGVATYTPAFFAAVERTGVAVGTIVAIGSGPFFAGVLEWLWRRVRPSPSWLVGTMVTVASGVVLVVAQTSGDATVDVVGVVLALAAGAGYALYSVTAKVTMAAGTPSTLAIAAPFTVGALAVVVMAAGEPYGWLESPGGLLLALHLGIAATGIAYLLYGFGLRRLTSATTVTLVLAEPVTATLLAVVVLSETLSALGWLAAVGVLAGLAVVGRSAELDVPVTPAGHDSVAPAAPRSASSGTPAATGRPARPRRDRRRSAPRAD